MRAAVVPRGTSWMSVLGGWIASLGMMALLAPIAAASVASRAGSTPDVSLAVPAVLAVVIAYLVGGYVAGRMAGYRTSWHGLMTAFFGLFVVLALLLVGIAAQRGIFGDVQLGSPDGYPWTLGTQDLGDALTFGAIIGFLATIFAGWLGGLLAPARAYVPADAVTPAAAPVGPVTERRVEERTLVPEARRPRYRLLPQTGRKGGERVERRERVTEDGEREIDETRVERR